MKYWCEIRTHGVNDAMTRLTSRETAIHRGILAGCDLFEFFQRIASLEESPTRENASRSPAMIQIRGPQGEFTVRLERGALLLEGPAQKVSPLTATLVVSGVLSPQQPAIAA